MNDPAVTVPAEPPVVTLLRSIRGDRWTAIHELLVCPHQHEPSHVTLMLALAALSSESSDRAHSEQALLNRFFQVDVLMCGYRLLGGSFNDLQPGSDPELVLALAPDATPAAELDRLLVGGVAEGPNWFISWKDDDRFILLFACNDETSSELSAWREEGR